MLLQVAFVLLVRGIQGISHSDGDDDRGERENYLQLDNKLFGRSLSQLAVCNTEPRKCVKSCFYEFIERGCYDPDQLVPQQTVVGLGTSNAVVGDYPFMLTLRVQRRDSDGIIIPNCYSHFCGAVLVWRDIALTAAHCLINDRRKLLTDDKPFSQFNTRLSVARFSQCRHQDGSEELFGQEAVIHPDYDADSFNNDIAIIKLRGDMSNEYGFIHLQTTPNDTNVQDAQILGFGATVLEKDFLKESTNLQIANVSTMTTDFCKSYFKFNLEPVSAELLNGSTMLCSKAVDADTCEGDSGGPLFLQQSSGKFTLLGIASWGSARQCQVIDEGQPPSISARISFYKDWIVQTVNQITQFGPYESQDDSTGTYRTQTSTPTYSYNTQLQVNSIQGNYPTYAPTISGSYNPYLQVNSFTGGDPYDYSAYPYDYSAYPYDYSAYPYDYSAYPTNTQVNQDSLN
eukprot:TRINITY_DN15253_c0_g1_i1.p1 TRINITY_DN15253_c0_g1~~TRINITY_DN15253_c0_g1_i1.p1  ORF type:complete len:457 (-),score=26.40 TRINITY_DN15253_c0_g1_i1:439-1809(-)